MVKNILWFKEINNKNIDLVGGKGASLGEMTNSDFKVPNGFCITAQAYELFIEKTQKQIMDLLESLDVEDTAQLDKISEEIRNIILKLEFSENLKEEITQAYEELGNSFVAIRSSATAEDLPEASFAGQQDTYLNIKGSEKVIAKTKECFASLFTSRAIYYRERNNFEHKDVLISVVVQKMVDSESAGVCFTVNPINKDYKEMVIEGAFGLGESVVSGQLTPDTFMIQKDHFKILQKHLSAKEWGYFKDEDGNTIKKDNSDPEKQSISDILLKELTKQAILIEKHYNKPMDIEWAIENNELFILQARPITTL